jgi:hypothetical protein
LQESSNDFNFNLTKFSCHVQLEHFQLVISL